MNQPDQPMEEWLSEVPHHLTAPEWQSKRAMVEAYINMLIDNNFARLLDLLYRLDISENKIRSLLLSTSESSSAALITDLIIERQLQKIAYRQKQQPDNDIPEEDRW